MDMIALETITFSQYNLFIFFPLTYCTGSVWGGVNFLTAAHLMLCLVTKNVDNALVFCLLLASACTVSQCVGLTLTGHQVPTKLHYHSSSTENAGEKNMTKKLVG